MWESYRLSLEVESNKNFRVIFHSFLGSVPVLRPVRINIKRELGGLSGKFEAPLGNSIRDGFC